jgi:hypothetical protein
MQGRPRSIALEHCDLLPQSEDLQGGIASETEEAESAPKSVTAVVHAAGALASKREYDNAECTQDGYEELP